MNSPNLTEKHSPIIKHGEMGKTYIVLENHPMEDKHYIMFVQVISKDNTESKIKYFYPNDKVIMDTDMDTNDLFSRSYCNIHGLYAGK